MPEERPNFVFVLSDQQRASALGCAGNAEVQTPRLDAFARQGTRLANAYTNSPLCGPSRACLVTGQYPTTNRVVRNDHPLPTDVPSVAEAFREAGYRTGYVGKWHLDGVPRNRFTPPGPRRQGFDDFWAAYNCAHDYFNARYYRGDSGELVTDDRYEPVVQTDLALEAIEEFAAGDEPFVLFLSWGPPHDPYDLVPDRYRQMYDPTDVTVRENAHPLFPGAITGAWEGGPPIKEWGPGTSLEYEAEERYAYDDQREIVADYYAAITALDDQFGRIVGELDDCGLASNTVLSYTSDHGDMLFSHGMNQKGFPHEESVNVPFIVRWPGEIPTDEVSQTLFSTVDVAPTLLGLADVDVPDAMEGNDLSDALCGVDSGPDSVYLFGNSWRGVRTDRYTYVRVDTDRDEYAHVPGGRAILWDNETDQFQLQNVVLHPEYADEVAELDARLDSWLDEVGDPFFTGDALVEHLGIERADAQREAYKEYVREHGRYPAEDWPPDEIEDEAEWS